MSTRYSAICIHIFSTATAIALTASAQPTGAGGFVPPTQEGTVIPPTPGGFVTVTPFTVASFTPIGGTGGNPTQSSGVTITPSGPALSGHIVYTVLSGDTLSDLAIRFNSDVDAIISANNLTADGLIVVGQNLVIPVPPTPTAAPIPPSQVPSGSPTAPIDGAVLTGPTVNGVGTYIVQAGDTFAAIARHYNLTVQGLAQLNGIVNPNNIPIGTVLVVPGPGNNIPGGTIAPTSYPATAVPVAPKTYVVQRGDDLYRISLKFNVTIQALMRVNNLANPNVIYVGQTLIIP